MGSPRLVVGITEGTTSGTFIIDIGATEYFVSQPVAIITATPNPAGANEQVTFDGSMSTHTLTPGTSKIVLYEWDFNYDGITFVPSDSGPTRTSSAHVYPAEGSYQAALRVTDDTGAQDIAVITVQVSAPTVPVITSPFSGGTSDSTPVITWTGGVSTFSLTVTNLSTGEVVVNETGLTTNSFTPPNSLAPGQYRAVVTATNLSGTVSSQPHTFEIVQISMVQPMNLELEYDTTPEFTFTAVPDAASYQIWVAELDPVTRKGVKVVINQSGINAAAALLPGTGNAVYEPSVPLPEGLYRVWVRAFDVNDNPGDWSAGNTFTLTKPTITGPAFQTGSTVDEVPVLTWTAVDVKQYQVWLVQLSGTDANGVALTGNQLILNTIVADTKLPLTNLGNGSFRAWVRAVGDDGEAGLWSVQYNFRRDRNVGPNLISPVGGVNETDRTPVFVWEAQQGADHYELWVNSTKARVIYDINVPHVEGASTISYTDPDITLFAGTHRWWVRAVNSDGGKTGWTGPATFFVPIPVVNAPTGTVVGTNLPTFSWTGVPEFTSYELWVNNLTTNVSQVLYRSGITTTSFTPTLPLENGTFRFWVRGTDAAGNVSQWSNPGTFSVSAAVGNAPRQISPSATVAFGSIVTFNWQAGQTSGVPEYELLVRNQSAAGQPIAFTDVITPVNNPLGDGTLIFDATGLSLNRGSYRWWVRGVNADGNPGPWAQPLDFRVVSADPSELLKPVLEDSLILLTSLRSDNAWTPEQVSIAVHPVANIDVKQVRDDRQPVVQTTESQLPTEAPTAFDAVMEDMAVSDWWTLNAADETVPAAAERPEGTVVPESETGSRKASASMLGLALAALSGRRRERDRQNQRSLRNR
ncbi:MAG: PKD domain-containing protein [Planctomycetaceae bacterium]